MRHLAPLGPPSLQTPPSTEGSKQSPEMSDVVASLIILGEHSAKLGGGRGRGGGDGGREGKGNFQEVSASFPLDDARQLDKRGGGSEASRRTRQTRQNNTSRTRMVT